MKSYTRITILFLSFLVILACEEEVRVPERDYPQVLMKDVIVSEGEVTFVAEIPRRGSFAIEEMGFEWAQGGFNRSDAEYETTVTLNPDADEFSFRLTSDMVEDQQYDVRAYLQTRNNRIQSDYFEFVSQGAQDPVLSGFSPAGAKKGETVTLSGESFALSRDRLEVFLGDRACVVNTNTLNEITFVVPFSTDQFGEQPITLISGDHTLTPETLFLIEDHFISDIEPREVFIGESITTIFGEAFAESGNEVFIGGLPALVISESETEIQVQVPQDLDRGSHNVEVRVDGVAFIRERGVFARTRWGFRDNFPGTPRIRGFFGVVGEKGYWIGGENLSATWDEVWEYDFELIEWTLVGTFPGGVRSQATGFVIDDQIYFGLGTDGNEEFSDFWRFDPSTLTWTQVGDFPGSPLSDNYHVVLAGEGYLLGGQEIWKYDPGGDDWEKLGESDVLPMQRGKNSIAMQSETRAFLIPVEERQTSPNPVLYEFDPTRTDFFQEVISLSFDPSQSLFGFVIRDQVFVGNGRVTRIDISSGATQFIAGESQLSVDYSTTIVKDDIVHVLFGSASGNIRPQHLVGFFQE